MIDLPIGVKFHIGEELIGVAEAIEGKNTRCVDCFFNNAIIDGCDPCNILACHKYLRKDRTDVYFREVKND